MKYNFSKVKLYDLEGKELKGGVSKSLGSSLYGLAVKDLELTEKAKAIYNELEVELDAKQLGVLKEVVVNERAGFVAFAQKAIFDYITSVSEEQKEKETPKK